MTTVNRGGGETIDCNVQVSQPPYDRGVFRPADDVVIYCTPVAPTDSWGFPVKITMTHAGALALVADLANRLAMAVENRFLPQIPVFPPVTGGMDVLAE